jgi:hypothetical protein
MTNKNIIYGGAGLIGVGVLYFLYSKFEKDNSTQSSVSSDNGYEKEDYNKITVGGKSKKNKKSNKKNKNSRKK